MGGKVARSAGWVPGRQPFLNFPLLTFRSRMISPKDERNLTAGFRRGDPETLRLAYREFAPRVHGFALRLTGQRLDAEDLTQEVFIAACAGRAGYDGRSRLITWLLGIAIRRWRDMNRRGRVVSVPLINERDLERSSMREGASKGQSLEMQTIDNLLLERALLQLGDRERENPASGRLARPYLQGKPPKRSESRSAP